MEYPPPPRWSQYYPSYPHDQFFPYPHHSPPPQPHYSPTVPHHQQVSTAPSQLQENVSPVPPSFARSPSANSPYYSGNWDCPPTDDPQLSQAQYSESGECDQRCDPALQGVLQDSSSHQHTQSSLVSLESQVLSQHDLQKLSLGGSDSPQSSQAETYLVQVRKAPSDYLRSNSFPLGSCPLQSDTERDRASSFSQPEPHRPSYYENELSSEEKDVIIDTKCMTDTIIRHMKSWEHTARVGYGFTEAEICHLKFDYQTQGFKECAYQAYLKWIQNEGYCTRKPLTAWTMLQALHKAKEFEAIGSLVKTLKTSEEL